MSFPYQIGLPLRDMSGLINGHECDKGFNASEA